MATIVHVHIADGFPVLSLTLVTEPLRVANREMGREAFTWRVVSEEGGARRSSSGMPVDTVALPQSPPDVAILLASYQPERSAGTATLAWLRKLDRHGSLLGCVDTGALVFARAGLLVTRPAAAHAEAIPGFQRQFPGSLFVDRLHDFTPPRCSSAGGVSTLDMTLALIAHFSDARIARRVAEILNHTPVMADLPASRLPGSVPGALRDAVAIMEANLGAPIRVADIARQLDLPVWKLNRLFQASLHTSPTHFYLRRRLARARDMLRNTTLSVGEIAEDCGYGNADVFSRAYRKEYGCPPSRDRAL